MKTETVFELSPYTALFYNVSASNVDEFMPSHFEMDYFVDFDTSTTFGTITHTLTALADDVTTVYMDVW